MNTQARSMGAALVLVGGVMTGFSVIAAAYLMGNLPTDGKGPQAAAVMLQAAISVSVSLLLCGLGSLLQLMAGDEEPT